MIISVLIKAPDDYIGINETIAINASTVHVVCRNITILEDKRFEYQEIFLVELCPLPDQNENLRYTITRLFIFINDTTVFIEGETSYLYLRVAYQSFAVKATILA